MLLSETKEANDFPIADTTNQLDDYEECGFVNSDDELDLPGYKTTYTQTQKIEIYLLKLCTEISAPLYAFEEIMKWAHNAYLDGYNFLPKQKTYCSQINNLEVWLGMEKHCPEEVSVWLPNKNGDDIIKVTQFDFKTQLWSLLDDPVLN